jgi:hypothetical protein
MRNYLKFLFLFVFISYSFVISAQLNYRNGYVITLQNDTLFGKINDGGSICNTKVCLFKSGIKSKKVKYYPADIKAYRFDGGKYYVSQKLITKGESKSVFTEVLLDGKISLYTDLSSLNMKYYLEMEDGTLTGLSNKNFRVQYQPDLDKLVYGKKYWLICKVFRDTLYSVFKASEKIQKQVDFVAYNHESLIKITKAYLNETCKENGCIKYEKDFKESRSRFGAFVGMQMSNIIIKESLLNSDAEGYKSDIINSFPIGVFCNFPISIINDRLLIQIEVITNSINYKSFGYLDKINRLTSIKYKTLGIPLMVKYEISNKKLSPTIAFGKETSFNLKSKVTRNFTEEEIIKHDYSNNNFIHRIQKGGWFCELGLDYELSPKLSLFSNLRFQTNHNIIVSDENTNHLTYSAALSSYSSLEIFKTNIITLYLGIKF